MDNNKLDAQLRRDTATADGLQADKALYQPLEDDMAPLREEYAANLAKARLLEDAVMGEDSATATQQKASAKALLKALAPRLAAALQGYAASKTNKDEDLAGRVRTSRSDLAAAGDATFATLVTALLKEAQPLAAQLAKREFTADDLAETARQLARFEKKQASQSTTVVAGATDRKTLTPCCGATPTSSRKCARSSRPTKTRPPSTRCGCASRATPSSSSSAGAGAKATPARSRPPKPREKRKAPPVAVWWGFFGGCGCHEAPPSNQFRSKLLGSGLVLGDA